MTRSVIRIGTSGSGGVGQGGSGRPACDFVDRIRIVAAARLWEAVFSDMDLRLKLPGFSIEFEGSAGHLTRLPKLIFCPS
jgi:hypothetical protein